MSNRLTIEGLEEFREALRHLPEDLTNEANDVVIAAAESAAKDIQIAYPTGPTGNLKRGVTVERNRSRFGASGIVRSRAGHASLFEFGSGPRQTARGANRGQMPVAPESERMLPIVIRARNKMQTALIDIVERAGFEVQS